MSTVKIQINDEKVLVSSPYNKEFVSRARELGGKWQNNQWNFDARDEDRVRQLCLDVYGTDGSPMPTTTMRISLDEAMKLRINSDSELIVGPITVLRKFDRDSKPALGPGCIVIEGGLESYGGSRNHPRITYKAGTVLEVREVPRVIANQLAADYPEAYSMVDDGDSSDELAPEEKSLVAALQALSPERLAAVLEQV